MTVWITIWVVLMMFWILGSGFVVYNGPNPNLPAYGTGTIIPWACVLILGLVIFGGINVGRH